MHRLLVVFALFFVLIGSAAFAQSADLARHVPLTPSALSRQLTRLRLPGLIKKVAHTYRYYLTRLGRSAIAAAGSITRFNIVAAMAGVHSILLKKCNDLNR